MQPDLILVFAGNYRQYEDWMREKHLCRRSCRYVTRPDQIRGLRDATYVKVGEWWLNPMFDLKAAETEAMLKSYNINEVIV